MKLKFMQEGGAVPAGTQVPQDPMQQLLAMAQQAVQTNDTNLALQVCRLLLELASQAQQAAPQQTAEPVAQEEPVFKAGGILARKIRK